MSAYRRGRLRYRRYVAVWIIVLIVGCLVFWQFYRQHQAGTQQVLDQNLAAQQLGLEAVRAHYQDSIATYFEEYVRQPETWTLLRDAQQPELRDEIRGRLLAHLAPAYQSMSARGIGLFHFHLPDSVSLLRFHQPDHYGDELASFRQSIHLANSLFQPVHGFETGRHAAGFRSVFPILDDTEAHLGSVEFSVPIAVLLNDLQRLDDDRAYRVVLNGEVQDLALLNPTSASYEPCAGFEQLMQIDAPMATGEGSGQILMLADLDRYLADQPDLWRKILGSGPLAFRLDQATPELTIAQVPLLAPDSSVAGWLLSCGREPALGQLDAAFRMNSLVVALGVMIFGLGGHALVRLTSTKLAERERLDLLTRSLGQGLYALNNEGVVTEVNPRACALLGYAPEQIIGQRAHQFFHVRSDKDSGKDICPLLAATDRGERFTGEKHFRRADGEIIEVSLTSMPLTEEEGSVTLFDDISKHKENERKLRHIAHYDALTGLPNRVLLADRLGLAMARARRSRVPLALAFVDLDGFKQVNDSHGHAVGDELLIRLAKRMKNCLRET
ncbi:MAG: diguanylate cyclase, partial [Wenzhouxiangella sp.]|nr:diguanylate cyclase [Wenzhouxiangella sp.]